MSFEEFLKVAEVNALKRVPRNSSNRYYDHKDGVDYARRETTAEHVYASLKVADFFLSAEQEFRQLDRLRVYEILLYHDDVEAITQDIGIAEVERRADKEDQEQRALPMLAQRYPVVLADRLQDADAEYRSKRSDEARFAGAIDKMEALLHEFSYPDDWAPKGFVEKTVREWFGPAFSYSPTFTRYFEEVISFLDKNGYF